MNTFDLVAQYLQPCAKGRVRIERFTVSHYQSRMSALRPRQYVPEGDYTRLIVGETLMMSDTNAERCSNYDALSEARGRMLIAGLGLGYVLVPILRKPEVTHVTVVELEPDVVDLVEPAVRAHVPEARDKLAVVVGDIFTWTPPEIYDTIYFDIWADICTDNLADITRLKRRFARRHRGWMGAWEEGHLRREARRERAQERAYGGY
jgi:hypothetical protein